ncbi:glycosyltransferase [Globicatella sp. PHS-GS-PNBC-21-1553]|uniref:glycosyltransferase n=1 Tax=Globicatella sp. PHS-GS-PNBC-21-1553 TaxID=2885764 RepID=UPI00298EEB14|nr:glycosyltransferase [Globicatella sp. PHS-GS-PNBC-21-1553]WPC09061.1 glycosyltransferase [Globicatella sp. PHS-GS-PNBC-21-1553]
MKKVLVILSAYKGEKYIEEQINSILSQKYVEVDLYIRDDGSNSEYNNIISKFNKLYPKSVIFLEKGENLKPAKSFMTALSNSYNEIYEYFLFADQDDIWLPDKIYEGIKFIEENSKKSNANILYFSSSTLIDNNLNSIGENIVTRVFSFSESLIRNNVQGATIIMNNNFVHYINNHKFDVMMMHDMWIHQVAQAIEAEIFVDERSFLLYRQHENNVLGMNTSIFTKIKSKLAFILRGNNNLRRRMAKNLLDEYGNEISQEKLDLLELIVSEEVFYKKLIKLLKIGEIWQGTIFQNFSFFLDIIFNRF